MSQAQRSDAALPHREAAGETLADLGEWELIRRLGAFAPVDQFGDDAALLSGRQEGQGDLVVNTDVLVEGLHFSDATTAAADVGWRAAAANFSDLAAMGCTEVVGITVGLVAPADTPWSWVEGVYRGLREALETHGGVLLGGDCSGGAQRMLAVTAIGRLTAPPATALTLQADEGSHMTPGSRPWGVIRRSDGRPGDALICTGPHGLSRLGLALLQGELTDRWSSTEGAIANPGATCADGPSEPPRQPPSAGGDEVRQAGRTGQLPLEAAVIQRAIGAHQRPVPRFDAVRALIGCRPAGLAWRVGGCDSSDGLAAAATAIARASGCMARLSRERLPLEPAMARLPQARAWCLNGGEDFELVLALEEGWAEALLRALPGATVFGELVAGTAGALYWTDGEACSVEAETAGGYQHFR
jgi:thiamine-monophosphate kinase